MLYGCGQERGDLALIGNHVIGAGRLGDITHCTTPLEHPHHRLLVGHQHWHGHLLEDLAGHASQHPFAQARMAVYATYRQVLRAQVLSGSRGVHARTLRNFDHTI